jgi:NAD(P)H dehydrogenase (quinone)
MWSPRSFATPARPTVLYTSADSLGINQWAHYSIDLFVASAAVPYSTIRPAIFSASLLAAVREVRASRTWTGLADSGRMALTDHRDVAEAGVRVLIDPALWGAHHDLIGPVPLSWPEALELLSAEMPAGLRKPLREPTGQYGAFRGLMCARCAPRLTRA